MPYSVPAGGGAITQWQTLTAGDTPGASLTLVVMRPLGSPGSNYTVVSTDAETIPNPLPISGVASYTLAHQITVQAGDTLGLYSASGGVNCAFSGGQTPYFDSLVLLGVSSPPPTSGQQLTLVDASNPGAELNVAATLSQNEDAGVATAVSPSNAAAGRPALLSSTVSNAGPSTGPITFVDQVPSGLTVDSASAGLGTCAVGGQTVTCTIGGLNSGQTVPVNVVVTPASAGSYMNNVSVGVHSPFSDPNAANNTASAALGVGPPAPNPGCVVPKLKRTPSSVAKAVLKDLGCKVTVKHKHSSVPKGDVLGTHPGPGTYAYQATVTVKVSSGKKH